jgi:hypothetical protein
LRAVRGSQVGKPRSEAERQRAGGQAGGRAAGDVIR